MSTSHSSSGAPSAAAGRGNDSDAEPKTKKQRLSDASAAPESQEDLHQKAISLVFGGELYSKLLGYGGQEAIRHFRGDRIWRKAMDELPADVMKSLKIPVVSRPSDAELFLLRGLLTKPLVAPSALPNTKLGWTLSDLGRRTLACSPLTSNKMLQNLVQSGCDEHTLRSVANRRDVSTSVIEEFIASDCPPSLFHDMASNPASSGEVLSAILVRGDFLNTVVLIGKHRNTNRFDLRYLSRHENPGVRDAVATNPKAVTLGLIQDLSTDTSERVRAGCAQNRNAPSNILTKLSTDKASRVRQAVAQNLSAGKALLAMIASSESDEAVLRSLAKNNSISVDEIFSISNARHRKVLARYSKQPDVLMKLIGMDNGKYDAELAFNKKAPADVLTSLAASDDNHVRRIVAENKNATPAIIEMLVQDDEMKRAIARNPSTSLSILEALATDEDNDVRTTVMENSAAPEKLLMTMLADPANANLDLVGLYCNDNLPLSSLVDAMDKQLESEGDLLGDLKEVVYERFENSKDALPRGTAVALSKCDDTDLREYSAQFPNLPVMDILRLFEDPVLDEVPGHLKKNPLLQVAVEKLSLLLSKDMVGSDSQFDDEERWW